ncbi:SRPBCC family protein [Mucilaginibacter sp. RS28]|uniref:SRPBCC family protein n=1 Tax=Mucilaginibacter straminoryzae TaxID=2932774 RepID=A0A9X1X0E5_9SPHI|nr:SRPBCC family protein [Mucilaginibacter straminoryzae]MCJ8208748.1 SRPBCC family protein [Mucilaginibacter straminoryzae]
MTLAGFMAEIILKTFINAPVVVCFNLSRSIDLHQVSTAHTQEKVIAGVTQGLIGLGETVTWRAKHFGIWLNLTSKITAFIPPTSFTDEMTAGPFAMMKHQHIFEGQENGTLMTDIFVFRSPLGLLGKLVDTLILKQYMRKLLVKRNGVIKMYAEENVGGI